MRDPKLGKAALLVGRHVMTSLRSRYYLPPLVCNFSAPVPYKTRDWILVTAKIRIETHKLYANRPGPVLYATDSAPTSKPAEEVATFY